MARFVDADELLKMMGREFDQTKKLIEKGEKHLDTLAEGYLEITELINRMLVKSMQNVSPERMREIMERITLESLQASEEARLKVLGGHMTHADGEMDDKTANAG